MTTTATEHLKAFDVRDPGILIDEISSEVPLTDGAVYLALVENPSSDQRLVTVDRFPGDCRDPIPDDLSTQICQAMELLPLPAQHHPVTHKVVTVIVRSGFTVMGRVELEWSLGWRYSNHLRPAFTGGLLLVTEHGWLDEMTGWAGHLPRMVG